MPAMARIKLSAIINVTIRIEFYVYLRLIQFLTMCIGSESRVFVVDIAGIRWHQKIEINKVWPHCLREKSLLSILLLESLSLFHRLGHSFSFFELCYSIRKRIRILL